MEEILELHLIMNSLQYYIERFRKMNRNRKGGETAPHKAVMLIAVMNEISCGHLTNCFVPVNDRMVKAFEYTWRYVVGEHDHFKCKFTYPFFHLSSEDWWKLLKTEKYIERKEYSSLKSVRENFYGALLPEDLWGYMENEASRKILTLALLEMLRPNRITSTTQISAAESAVPYSDINQYGPDDLLTAA